MEASHNQYRAARNLFLKHGRGPAPNPNRIIGSMDAVQVSRGLFDSDAFDGDRENFNKRLRVLGMGVARATAISWSVSIPFGVTDGEEEQVRPKTEQGLELEAFWKDAAREDAI